MLQKFLFVGLGGSGGKTLRFLHDDLTRRLQAKQWHGDLPGGWQFVHIDVPVTADGLSPDLPAQLSRRSYVGLAPSGLTYADLDEQLAGQGSDVVEYVAPWRPRADRVGISPAIGAGQFRAVGRAITAASMHKAIGRLRQAVNTLSDVAIDTEFSEAARLLTGSGDISERAPQVILVSSVAGGSGAGSVLDIADAMRHLADPWGGQAVSVLYLPDVFSDVPDAQRAGVTANALATLSEIMNAFWDDGALHRGADQPLLTANSLPPTAGPRRGPRYPLLVGRSNGNVHYATQNDVYRAMAKSLASWMTNPHVQDTMAESFHGNWANTAEARADATRLAPPPREVPFSAMGYASVGLGRERFAQYASQRLAAHAVDRLLFGHITDEVRSEQVTQDEAAQKRASDVRHQFMDRCQLRELGPHDNQVIDLIRGGVGKGARREHLDGLRQEMHAAIASGSMEVDSDLVLKKLNTRYSEKEPRVVGEIFEDDAERTRNWCEDVQAIFAEEVARLLGQEGARVTEFVLRDVKDEIEREVIPELRHDASGARAYAAHRDERVSGKFAGVAGKIKVGENPAVAQAIEECVDAVYAQAEARMLDMTASVLADFAAHLVGPSVDAVVSSRKQLEAEYEGTPQQPSELRVWTRGPVPQAFEPAQNEILLEETAGYEEAFLSRVRASVDAVDFEGARSIAMRQVIAGEDPAEPDAAPQVVQLHGRWVPAEPTLSLTRAPARASFRIRVSGDDLADRARDWVYTPGTAMSAYVTQSLRDYLAPDGVDPREHAARLDRFRVGLQQLLRAATPLIHLDQGRLAAVHGGVGVANERPADVITPFPFDRSHPARAVVREVLHDRDEQQLASMFDDSEIATVELTTLLGGQCQPNVIQSVFDPIKSDWMRKSILPGQSGFWDRRRARGLTEFVPAPPEVLQAMVTGWHVGRLLGWIHPGDLTEKGPSVWTPRGEVSFPFPFLGGHVRTYGELLPAVLESFALTLLDEPQHVMRPYWQLMSLGARGAETEAMLHEAVDRRANGALRAWLSDGQVLEGAPVPDPNLQESAVDDRVDAALEELGKYEEHYRKIADGGWPEDRALQRLWELRVPLLEAIFVLTDEVETSRRPDQGATW